MAERAVLRKGQRIERVKDGRPFLVTFVNMRAPVPVFSAEPLDNQWSHWGGPIPHADEIRELQPSDASKGDVS